MSSALTDLVIFLARRHVDGHGKAADARRLERMRGTFDDFDAETLCIEARKVEPTEPQLAEFLRRLVDPVTEERWQNPKKKPDAE
jgi:hypothetical protein